MLSQRSFLHQLLTILLLLALFQAAAIPTQAATTEFVVTKTADTADGRCDADCSLREAIIAANANPGRDTVQVPAGLYLLTLAGTGEDAAATGDLDITDDLTLRGVRAADVQIDGNLYYNNHILDRVIDIRGSISVELAQVTIQHGFMYEESSAGIRNNAGSLRLVDCIIQENYHSLGGSVGNGGDLTVIRTIFKDNEGGNGAGAISNGGTLQIEKSTIYHNNGTSGGAISNSGTVTITESLIENNTGMNGGIGAFSNYGTMTVISSTVRGNSGEFMGMMYNRGIVTFLNSLITRNGGESVSVYFGGPGLTVINTTVTENYGRVTLRVTDANIINSTLADNRIETAVIDGSATLKQTVIVNRSGFWSSNCSSSSVLSSAGYNLDSDGSCHLSGDGDLSGVDPKLGLFSDHGGPTLTYSLLPGSPAYNHIPTALCATTVDQRGVARPQGAGCDIGAFEAEAINKGRITIYKESQPKSIQDFAYYGPFGKFFLDDTVPDDNDGVPNAKSYLVNPGTYNFAEGVFQSWHLADMTCVGTGSYTTNMAQRSVGVTVGSGQEMSCTFVTQRRVNLQAINFNDLDGDGLRLLSEPLLPGWEIRFYKEGGSLINHKVTDNNGTASQNNVIPSFVQVCETPKAGWTNTLPGQIDPVLALPCYDLILQPGQNATIFFGNTQGAVVRPSEEIDPNRGVTIDELPDINEPEGEEMPEESESNQNIYLPLISR